MRKYCKAYHLSNVRQFKDWEEQCISTTHDLSDESIVYLWDDYTITISPIHQNTLLFSHITPQWQDFCTQVLDFTIPEDLRYAYTQQQGNSVAQP